MDVSVYSFCLHNYLASMIPCLHATCYPVLKVLLCTRCEIKRERSHRHVTRASVVRWLLRRASELHAARPAMPPPWPALDHPPPSPRSPTPFRSPNPRRLSRPHDAAPTSSGRRPLSSPAARPATGPVWRWPSRAGLRSVVWPSATARRPIQPLHPAAATAAAAGPARLLRPAAARPGSVRRAFPPALPAASAAPAEPAAATVPRPAHPPATP